MNDGIVLSNSSRNSAPRDLCLALTFSAIQEVVGLHSEGHELKVLEI